jgi:hypothetical protein
VICRRSDARDTCKSVTPGEAEQWGYVDPARPLRTGMTGTQDMLFTTPLDVPDPATHSTGEGARLHLF